MRWDALLRLEPFSSEGEKPAVLGAVRPSPLLRIERKVYVEGTTSADRQVKALKLAQERLSLGFF